ncbi:crAss001_48 related protein [Pseudoramibacter porci]|uniref:Uncharacterized protein n=1 Tax=Pseudoramibacter porci TaxID=2606631 RepID=A0A7X2T9J6_9FIRM|nr:hypothetical protein [Pseudoramibacter porci]MSS18863.1 hypothetical protein [Pseudoramibacter porci]
MKELKETIADMTSTDYRRRMAAEYNQLKIRVEKLENMLDDLDAGTLPFTPRCPRSLLYCQYRAMLKYLNALELRAAVEGIML